jgi:hypothetical protein
MKRTAIAIAIVAVLAAGGASYAALGGGHVHGPNPWVSASGDHSSKIKVSGHVKGLYPGRERRLRVGVRNGYRSVITVKSVTATVKRASSGCPKGTISTTPYEGRGKIRAHRTKPLTIRVKMRRSAPDACQGTKFKLRFKARARHP